MIQMYPALRASADALYTPEASRFLPAYLPTDANLEAQVNGDAAVDDRRRGRRVARRHHHERRAHDGAVRRAPTPTTRRWARTSPRFDETALAAAAQADADFAAGVDRGPLQGIPLGVKDIIAAREGATTACSKVLDPDWGRGVDAPAVARLRAQGAVITGKTTTMEFAMGAPDADGPFPTHRNPWDLERWPGGSSAGTGTGVAAGPDPRWARQRHRRQRAHPRRAVRHLRAEDHVRVGAEVGRRAARLQPRHRRARWRARPVTVR